MKTRFSEISLPGLWTINFLVTVGVVCLMDYFKCKGDMIGLVTPSIALLAHMAFRHPTDDEPVLHKSFLILWLMSVFIPPIVVPSVTISSDSPSFIIRLNAALMNNAAGIPIILTTLFWLAHTACRDTHRLLQIFARIILFGSCFFGIIRTILLFRE